jgi:hypothetical protein
MATLAESCGAEIARREERVDACQVPKELKMTLVLDPPTIATRSTWSAALSLEGAIFSTEVELQPEADEASILDSHCWPEGIDYARWAAVAQPSPRSAFADRLDIVDLLAG